jgi:cardiolipin synthase
VAYLLFVIFVSVAGIIFYFMFGTNYSNKRMYTEKLFVNDEMARKLKEDLDHNSKQVYEQSNAAVQRNKELFICC